MPIASAHFRSLRPNDFTFNLSAFLELRTAILLSECCTAICINFRTFKPRALFYSCVLVRLSTVRNKRICYGMLCYCVIYCIFRHTFVPSRKSRSSANADGPRDATCQSESCQLLHNLNNKLYNTSRTSRSNEVGSLQSTNV